MIGLMIIQKNIKMIGVRQGGTLIAHNYSTRSLIGNNGIGNVKH